MLVQTTGQGKNPDRGGFLFENRSDNKLARISMVMLYVETVVMIFGTRLNRAVTSQNAFVMLKRALDIEKFDH